MRMDELAAVAVAHSVHPDRHLMIGFNRRFAPLTRELRQHFSAVRSPKVVNIRVNAGFIPPDHWMQDPEVGGGRLIGEACHFIDLASALVGADPVSVHTVGSAKQGQPLMLNDNVCVSLRFADGSIANVTYTADGAKAMAKEQVEMFGGGRSAVIDDFRNATLYEGDTGVRHIKGTQDKGQRDMLAAWVKGMRSGQPALPFATAMAVSAATIAAVESMTLGAPVDITPALWQPPVAEGAGATAQGDATRQAPMAA